MPWHDDLGVELLGACDGGVEVVQLEPQEHAISRRDVGVSKAAVVVLDVPAVQLEDQPITPEQLFVLAAPMAAAAPEQELVPPLGGP